MQPPSQRSFSAPPPWPAVFGTTLGWLEQHLGLFLLGQDTAHEVQLARIKLLVELTLACDLGLLALGGTDAEWPLVQVERLRRMQQRLRQDLAEGRRPANLMRHVPPPQGMQLSALASLAEILDRWGAAEDWPAHERPSAADAHPPWIASLDVVAACRALGFGEPAACRDSAPGRVPNLPHDAAYALVHVIMFRTHFGRTAGFAAAEVDLLRAWIPVWQQQSAEARDVDLLGELTIAARCLRSHDDPIDVAALFQQAQESDGAIVGLQEAQVPPEAGPEVCSAWFQRRYHTTIVANMAAALSLVGDCLQK